VVSGKGIGKGGAFRRIWQRKGILIRIVAKFFQFHSGGVAWLKILADKLEEYRENIAIL